MTIRSLAAIACLCASAPAVEPSAWVVVQDSHFEVYSQSEAAARDALARLERLRVKAERRLGWSSTTTHRLRVIDFRCEDEFAAYRPRPLSDGYYAGSQSRDYIALPGLDAEHGGALAHEYAHALIHSIGLDLPFWFSEGFAEVFSMAEPGQGGDDVAARIQLLRRRPWLPLSQVISLRANSPLLDNRNSAEMFYAQSWALAEMLLRAPGYAPRGANWLASVSAGAAGGAALEAAYGKSLETIARDMRNWVARRPQLPPASTAAGAEEAVEARPVNAFAMRLLLGDLMVTSRQLDRAETLFSQLARADPDRPEPFAGLGVIAMARGNRNDARRWWKRALDLGLADADICYRYAALLDGAGVTGDELRFALERTLELRPNLDEARWSLALLEESQGRPEASLAQLRAIETVAPERASGYWCAAADALLDLGRNDEASQATAKALELAATSQERERAARLQQMARTHLGVQFRTDSSGRQEAVITRVPNDAADWNPFIEPGDEIHRASGMIEHLDCAASGIEIEVRTAGGLLRLTIPDPGRVRVRPGPAEFTCGAQVPAYVTVEYAAGKTGRSDGVARGIEFRR